MREAQRPYTAEDIIRRYNLEELKSDRKAISTLRDGLTKTDTNLEEFVGVVTKDIEDLQKTTDGRIETYFKDYAPTNDKYPTNEWTTEDTKYQHVGDLFYDNTTGYAYRYLLDNTTYKWVKLSDSDVTEALALANSAKDTADSKRRVFVATPFTPYEIGDIWFKDNKYLYRCSVKREYGDYSENDWIPAVDYSNDDVARDVEAQLNKYKESVSSTYATKTSLITSIESIEGKVNAVVGLAQSVTGDGSITLTNYFAMGNFSIIGNIDLTFPSDNLYPSNNLYGLNTNLLCKYLENGNIVTKTIKLPFTYLNYISDSVCDEFIVGDGKSYIIRRVGVNDNGELYKLDKEVSEVFEDYVFDLPKATIELSMQCFADVKFGALYMPRNAYTNTFATQVELNSFIEQTADSINTKVSKGDIVSEINQNAEEVKIHANKIDINGVVSANNYFKILEDGSVETSNLKLLNGGKVIGGDGILSNLQFIGASYFNGHISPVGAGLLGYRLERDVGNIYTDLVADVVIPDNFTVDKVYITMLHQPITWYNNNGISTKGNSRNIQAYKITNFGNATLSAKYESEIYMSSTLNYQLIEGAMGSAGHTFGNTNAETFTSEDISKVFNGSGRYAIAVRTQNAVPEYSDYQDTNIYLGQSTGYVYMIVNVIGYMSHK